MSGAEKRIVLISGPGEAAVSMAVTQRVLAWFNLRRGLEMATVNVDIDNATAAFAVPDVALSLIRQADAVVFSNFDVVRGGGQVLSLRPVYDVLQVVAAVRPVQLAPALKSLALLSTQHPPDLMVIHDLSGFGLKTDESDVLSLGRLSFSLARMRRNAVCVCLPDGDAVQSLRALHAADYADVRFQHLVPADSLRQLIQDPGVFDVVLTTAPFGALFWTTAATMTGTESLLPTATLAPARSGRHVGIYGPASLQHAAHIAPPLALAQGIALMFRYSFDLDLEAVLLEHAIAILLERGLCTADFKREGGILMSTVEMGEALIHVLEELIREDTAAAAAVSVH